MQFHHHGYVSTDPRIKPAQGKGLDRPSEIPDEIDVLIVGSGPAGMLLAAQLSQYPSITTRIIEKREGRLAIGHADGIQARSVETFQAFGFADEITNEAYQICEMNFWAPSKEDPTKIVRTKRTLDDENGISEFPHLIVNQARVLDYFAKVAKTSPARIEPDFGVEFCGLQVGEGEYPVTVNIRYTTGERSGEERTIKAKYVVGCDGARSKVRESIGRKHIGQPSLHAWGVADILAVTDFPDIRMKCAIQSQDNGSILLIPREGGYLFRMYIDLGDVDENDNHQIRSTPLEDIIAQANAIMHPYTIDVKNVAWWSVYEVGHRVTDKFDDVDVGEEDNKMPHVFICGDACHTHSAKAGQGMNVSMQDAFNLGWKLGSVLTKRSPESLLATYSAERQVVAQDLITFDKEWSSLMAKKPDEFENPDELSEYYVRTAEFPAGFMTQYEPSMLIGDDSYQHLAKGYPIGKRFKSAPVVRIADAVPIHLGHHAQADGRWRIYAFADAKAELLDTFANWLHTDANSPLSVYTPKGEDMDSVFDVKVIYQQSHHDIEMTDVHEVFLPLSGPFQVANYEKAYTAKADEDIFDEREIDRGGVIVVVRPDQYVAAVLPLAQTDALADFFANNMLPV
ncbi:FAD-binding monooxygenase [Psychrobacter sp. I-STPA10]|uniref:FAD-binding monooxygenase n=1 Tax=Psychrobacter sp. I-STPA10 TaxID=2585769 RepID=UPI001E5A275D|nr:FAD-binding monooxygenase [Psychrobacter sp. I-STPA10]